MLIINIIYCLFSVISLVLILFNLPGTFLITIFSFVRELIDTNSGIRWELILILLFISLLLEGSDYLISIFTIKRYGGSRAGIWGAILGGIIGGIVGSGFMPIIGSLLGVIVFSFFGALFFEIMNKRELRKAFSAGKGAFFSFIFSKIIKLSAGIIMIILTLVWK
ncbi:MAG: DUF456 domain-containing protein [Candidatus Marinimicrobia bacterium]|nr:DUF456 domain-containing protein [Candidatus Neomarinimicrobiota bacterium]